MTIQFSNELKTKQFYVYKITYQNGKPFYIGKGQNCRYKIHFKTKRKTELSKFIRKKLKTQSLRVVIIKDNLTEEKAFELEVKLIKKYGRIDKGTGVLYNKTDGGGGISGLVFNNKVIKKMSKNNAKYWLGKVGPAKGRVSPMKNKRHSEETKLKTSKSMKKSWKDKDLWIERNKNLSKTMKGKPSARSLNGYTHSEETKEKISKSLIGKLKGRIPWNKGKKGKESNVSL